MALCSPIRALIVDVASPRVQLDTVLTAVLYSLNSVSMLTCILDALVDVPDIDSLELISLRSDLRATPGSCIDPARRFRCLLRGDCLCIL